MDTIECFEVRRDDLRTIRLKRDQLPELEPGQVLLKVDRFGLTANDITYGVVADMVGYWEFFPAEDGWGRLPGWGFADVAAGDVEGLEPGSRFYGYLPMASHLVVQPVQVSRGGFTDGAAHRADLPGVYNRYRSTSADDRYRPETDDIEVIFAPLFTTSFVLDDYLADNGDFGAARVVLSSASSKTAAGTALCLSRRGGDRPRIVGLTSPSNMDFVAGLGCYDEVVAYDDVASLDPAVASVFVDVAGDAGVRAAVHRHLGDRLTASQMVGMTHWTEMATDEGLPGPAPQLFFAPVQIEKRMADWGPAGYQQRLGAAWDHLLGVVGDWVEIVELDGLAALDQPYHRVLEGDVPPSEAYVVVLDQES